MNLSRFTFIVALIAILVGCGSSVRYGSPDRTRFEGDRIFEPGEEIIGWREQGQASYYGKKFHGRRTANGEVYDMYGISAAHRTLPFGARVRVTHLANGRTIEVRINDRGPFIEGRIIDLSYGAAQTLGMVREGVVPVEIEVVR
ncbi:MAG: hypothetical protein CME06_03345 [Gemmatimonadetes bacterium]|nr:hypothetical protein [Gemmatimonadota bacterium]